MNSHLTLPPSGSGGDTARASQDSLLRHLQSHAAPPPEKQVFVNRSLRLETIRAVGFDLDWTLADYERMPMEKLTFELTLERLISAHGYPEAIREVEFRPDFPRRGLLIDKEAGTVLSMSRHRYVGRAYLGRQRLDRRDLKRLYRYEPIHPTSQRFYHLDSLFELPEANLFAELVELAGSNGGISLPDYQRIFADVRQAIDWVHAEGALKRKILASISTFLRQDPEVMLALRRLAMAGRKLILITNSDWTYTEGICSYLFAPEISGLENWREIFDLIIVSAGKPAFFRAGQDFVEIGPTGEEDASSATPKWGGLYRGGSLGGLMNLLNIPGEQVLYVGDHIYGDIVTSKLESTWRTLLIVRELEEELLKRSTLADELSRHHDLRQRLLSLGFEMDRLRDLVWLLNGNGHGSADRTEFEAALRSRLKEVSGEHRQVMRREAESAEKLGANFDPYWGSFFKQDTAKTRFAGQIEAYACLYTSRVANFAYYGSNHYFRVLEDPMIHELDLFSYQG